MYTRTRLRRDRKKETRPILQGFNKEVSTAYLYTHICALSFFFLLFSLHVMTVQLEGRPLVALPTHKPNARFLVLVGGQNYTYLEGCLYVGIASAKEAFGLGSVADIQPVDSKHGPRHCRTRCRRARLVVQQVVLLFKRGGKPVCQA